ncbi:hypothetical protein [Aquipuribacter sp. SD81]|uniref:hypothetical protein n=1 Tax=Aquipuribacter sp. SD81 TaxID=3127703 RepID=UPI0030158FEC
MADLSCPACTAPDEHVRLVAQTASGQKELGCEECGHRWLRGQARRVPSGRPPGRSSTSSQAVFDRASQVSPEVAAKVTAAKARYLARDRAPRPGAAQYQARYQALFSPEGLGGASAADLREFATSPFGVSSGSSHAFLAAWDALGDYEAARLTRGTIHYLLHGPAHLPLEQRLTQLVQGTHVVGMAGFKETLLTRTLCVAHPERFLPVLGYGGTQGGKRSIAKQVFGLDLPRIDSSAITVGRAVVWSNDLLVGLVGTGFTDLHDASLFLLQARKERVAAG